MNSEKIFKMTLWLGATLLVGIGFNVVWAIVFWNNDTLFIWHWLGLPFAMLVTGVGMAKELS